MRGPESIKDMHMIHCVCPNRTQQWLVLCASPFQHHLKVESEIWDLDAKLGLFGTIFTLWSYLGPSHEFGILLERLRVFCECTLH